jgi:O-antigen ligase
VSRPSLALPLPETDPSGALVGLGAVVLAVAVGAAASVSPVLTIAAAVGAGFAFVSFRSLPAGLAFFVLLTFFERLPGSAASGLTLVKLAGFVLAVAWLVDLANRRAVPFFLRDRPVLAYAVIFFLGWSLASMLWAPFPGAARADFLRLFQGLILFLIAFSAIRKPRHLLWVIWAYVGGAAMSAIVGLAGGTSSEQFTPYNDFSRLSGGIGDPNELAAILVPAVVFAAFLLPISRSPVARWLLLVLIVLFSFALFLTQSRGGIVALIVVLVFMPILAGPVRVRALAVVFATVAIGIGYYSFVASPEAIKHVSAFSVGSGTGREDLWAVATEIFKAHPVAGIGLGNFPLVEPDYATRNINLPRADLVVEQRKVVHNTYLHILTELGIVGMIPFAVLMTGCLALAWSGVRTFALRAERRLEILARGIVIGTIGMLAAFFFISAQYEKQLWLLLGVCAALSTLARAGESAET